MTITLRELAGQLGLSLSTVSKALNGRPDVGSEVRTRVLEAAAQQGYVANPIARKLVLGENRTLGVFLLNRLKVPLRDFFGFQYLEGILQEARDRGFDLHLFSHSLDTAFETSYLDLLRTKGLPGAVFIGLFLDDPFIRDITRSPLPLAVLDTLIKGDRIGFITSDNRLGIQLAMEHLWALGHRRFGFLSFSHRSHAGNTRRRAFKAFLEERNSFEPEWVAEDTLDAEGGERAAMELLDRGSRPTALVAASDFQAIGALRAAQRLGLNVPGDLSVTGFDDIQASGFTSPALTTVAQDTAALGRSAAAWVLDSLAGQAPWPNRRMIAPTLVVRGSTGPSP